MLELLIALKLPLLILQIILSPILILFVLLQSGKGDDITTAFSGMGGGGGQVQGSGGTSKFLVRGTVIVVTLFMVNSIALAKIYKDINESGIGTQVSEPLAPATAPVTPPATAPATETTPAPATK